MPPSALDKLIPPEISRDRFWRAIRRLAMTPGLEHVLEIGSSTGEGSTAALVSGLLANPDSSTLHCMEVSTPRYEALRTRYREHEFVHCYNTSSVGLDRFPSPEEVTAFFHRYRPRLRRPSLALQLQWLRQDVDYLEQHGISDDGIRRIKTEHGIDHFDLVLIDGSEFTGRAELEDVYGARFLLLDDILTFKNHENYRALLDDPAYRLLERSRWLRNGYAVFSRDSVGSQARM